MRVKLLINLLLCIAYSFNIQADIQDIFSSFFTGEQKTLFATVVQEKQDQINRLKEEIIVINKDIKEKNDLDQQRLDALNEKVVVLEKELALEKERIPKDEKSIEFYTEIISRLTDQRRLLTNTQLMRKQLPILIQERIMLLQGYIKDPEFLSSAVERRALYPIQVFIDTAHQVLEANNDLKQLAEKQKDANLEIDKYKRELEQTQKIYTDKKREQEDFKTKSGEVTEAKRFDLKQQGQLLDTDTTTALYEQELAQIRLQLAQAKKGLLDTQQFLAQERERVLKNNLSIIKGGLRVDESDLTKAQEQLEKAKRAATKHQNFLFTKINPLTNELEVARKASEKLIKDKDIQPSTLRELADWNFQAKTVEEYLAYAQVALAREQIDYLERSIDVYNAEIEREKAKVRQQDIHAALLHTWFTLKRREFKETEELARETKKYKALVVEIERDIANYKEKRINATNRINVQNKTLNTLRELRKQVQENELFKDRKEIQAFNGYLDEAEKLLKERIAKNTAYLDVYTELIAIATKTLQDLKIIITELETKGIWQRSEYAISWEGIKNIVPDLRYFVADAYYIGASFFAEFTWKGLYQKLYSFVSTPQGILFFLVRLIALLAVFFLLRSSLPRIQRLLLQVEPEYKVFYILSRILAAIAGFIYSNFISIFIWGSLFLAVGFGYIDSLFLRIVFYLGSIPYLMYLVVIFIRYFIKFNAQQGYVIFPESFERRFTFIFSLLAYISIILLFFRQAFVLATIHKSELPTILLAIYSILAVIFLLFSIGKEEIIALLPQRGRFWVWLAEQINRFYYPMLGLITCIMVISDPYVGGYKNLVNYILWGLIYTALLFWFLSLLHRYLKQASQAIFFYTDNDILKERFSYGRTWYGLFAIFSFFALILVGLYVGFTIWGFPISFERINEWFNFGLLPIGYDRETNQFIYVTPFKVFAIILIIISGFILASLINRYILGRIFTVLPVDLGVQNTVMSITRFLVVMLAILIGFLWANLGTLLIAIGLVIGSIGYIVKEPISDFVSYFIILVQRPIQIGDYVELNEEHTGVVRRITPRSVILRKKNSYTIVVPNSLFVTQPVSNWNYARNYIAFDDIFFTVPYKSDPEVVRKLIEQVLDENINVLKSPTPIIRLHLFADHGFIFMVRGFLTEKNILNKWDIASDIRFAIVKKLRVNNINFAFPMRHIIDERHFFVHDSKTDEQKEQQ